MIAVCLILEFSRGRAAGIGCNDSFGQTREEIMKTHELKTDPAVFQAVLDGRKTYEIRRNDRGFSEGDRVRLLETQYTGAEMAAGAALLYTGREVVRDVTHALHGPVYGLAGGWSIISLSPNTASSGGER